MLKGTLIYTYTLTIFKANRHPLEIANRKPSTLEDLVIDESKRMLASLNFPSNQRISKK